MSDDAPVIPGEDADSLPSLIRHTWARLEAELLAVIEDAAVTLNTTAPHSLSRFPVPTSPEPADDRGGQWMRREDFDTFPCEPRPADFPIPAHLPQVDPERVTDDPIQRLYADYVRVVRDEIARIWDEHIEAIRASVPAVAAPPGDPRERALEHVRNRNTGPQQSQRAPRRLDPRRRR